jgi:hypothetical protein
MEQLSIHSVTALHFATIIPWIWFIGLCVIVFLLSALSLFLRHKNAFLRTVCAACFLFALSGPYFLISEKEKRSDTGIVLVDRSESQAIAQRSDITQKAIQYLQQTLKDNASLNLRIVETDSEEGKNGTHIFKALKTAFQDIAIDERAGAIIITDGQIHDAAEGQGQYSEYGPLHFLLTGNQNEKDRQVQIIEASPYGITNQKILIKYIVKDNSADTNDTATITIRNFQADADSFEQTKIVPLNIEQSAEVDVTQAGKNIYEISTSLIENELSKNNNSATFEINGIRERLKVLLVSGQPYTGARVWRDLLTSDPAVDLVHFTILREPDKIDPTPSRELALIAFPMEELFETKLSSFDLVIFDRYDRIGILPDIYFENIRNYVQKGGALLLAHGPFFSEADSIYNTAFRDILPAAPDGRPLNGAFTPKLTAQGTTHPVTRNLVQGDSNREKPVWGSWLRQVPLKIMSGDALMEGTGDRPLLVLSRNDQGRVAQIASDQIWLWARGFEGGGPHTELLRKTIHWLMKEPELDERLLDIQIVSRKMTVASQDIHRENAIINVTDPAGGQRIVKLDKNLNGKWTSDFDAPLKGVYIFKDEHGYQQIFSSLPKSSLETQSLLSTSDIVKPAATATGGGIFWLAQNPEPVIKTMSRQKHYAGSNWLGLRENNQYTVKNLKQIPFIPPWVFMLSLVSLLLMMWWREGRS